jgi:hypothetical protein
LQNSTSFFGIPLTEKNRAAIKKKMYDMLQQLTGTSKDARLLAHIRNRRRRSPGAMSPSTAEESLYGYSHRLNLSEGSAVFRSSSVDPIFKIKSPTPGPGSYDVPSTLGSKGTNHPDPSFRSGESRFKSRGSEERYRHIFYTKDRNRPPTPSKKSFHLNKPKAWNPL